ncbi:MAG: 5'-methylthioadenosine/adenosylhomocysteine nucleosidase [Geminicoccaceae bacterium]
MSVADPVGIICAIPQELTDLRRLMGDAQNETVAGARFASGELDGQPVVLAEAGIGKVNAAFVTTMLAARYGARAVLFSGVAGGLDPSLHIGDVVVGIRTIQHDAGVIEHGQLAAYQAGHVPFFNPTDQLGYDLDQARVHAVQQALGDLVLPLLSRAAGGEGKPPRIVLGTVLTGDCYVHCEATRVRLFETFQAQAVEMEGAAVAQICTRFGLPWLDIRALSDLAGAESSFDFASFVHEVAQSSVTVLRRVLPVFAA